MQSRYYNPEIGRFINMDDRIVADGNVFAYCSDNPIMLIDAQGDLGHYMCGWAYPESEANVKVVEKQWEPYLDGRYGAYLTNIYIIRTG